MTGIHTGSDADIVVVGAGAAGLFAALSASEAIAIPSDTLRDERRTRLSICILDATKRPGLKILVSGGGRCNLTNARVEVDDFVTDAPRALKSVLGAFDHRSTREWFESKGLSTYEEPQGKVFPTSDDARDVLSTLIGACESAGISIHHECEVTDISLAKDGVFRIDSRGGTWRARSVILATGGRSLPKTGSMGAGFEIAARLGHTVTPQVPALVNVRLAPGGLTAELAGLTLPARLDVEYQPTSIEQRCGRKYAPVSSACGSVLVTHDGLTGPAALDISGAVGHGIRRSEKPLVVADFWSLVRPTSAWPEFANSDKAPGACVPPSEAPSPTTFDTFLADVRSLAGASAIVTTLTRVLPKSLVSRILERATVDGRKPASTAPEGEWRKIYALTCHSPLPAIGTGGYDKAAVTDGGILLGELDRRTLESTRVPGLLACGEVVNVTGRLGGFNFQWAWSSGFVAGTAARERLHGT